MVYTYPSWNSAAFAGTRWSVFMPNAYYVAKSGNDETGDGSPTRPFRTLLRAAQGLRYFGIEPGGIVVGSGVYTETLTERVSTRVYGDGLVTLDGTGLYALTNVEATFYNLSIANYATLSSQIIPTLINCQVRNVYRWANLNSGSYGQIDVTWRNCLFVNCFASGGANWSTGIFSNLTFINSTFYTNGVYSTVSASYFDAACVLAESMDNEGHYRRYFNCSVLGRVGSGNLPIDQATAVLLNVFQNCVALDAQFNNPTAGDYTLAQTSPIRNLSAEGTYVGAYGVGLNFSGLADAEVLVNATWDAATAQFVPTDPTKPMSVEFATKDTGRVWVLNDSYVTGREDNIDHQTIDVTYSYENVGGVAVDTPSGAVVLGKGYWVMGYDTLMYNGHNYLTDTFLYGEPGVTTYETTGVGKLVLITETPNIRLMELKYSSTSQGDCDSRNYKLFMANRQPTYNTAGGKTNGEQGFNLNAAEALAVRWLKVRLTILPNSIA